MAGSVTCPQCGRDIADAIRSALIERVLDWQMRHVLDADTADAFRRDLDGSTDGAKVSRQGILGLRALSPSMALLIVGGILVVSAVVMAATQLWDTLTPLGRLSVVAVPAALAYGSAAYLRARRMVGDWLVTGLALVGSCLAPFVVWLALGMSEPMAPEERRLAFFGALATGTGLIIQLATLAWLRAAPLTIPASLDLVFCAGWLAEATVPERGSGAHVSLAFMAAGAVLMAAGQVLMRRGLPRHAIAPNGIGVAVALFAMTVLGAEHHGPYNVLSLIVPVGLIFAACSPALRVYLWAAAAFLVINIFRVGLSEFAQTAGLPVALLGCGLASLLTGYVVHRVRHEYAP
jgi:hypothetical protein